jgi:hypothetical protein
MTSCKMYKYLGAEAQAGTETPMCCSKMFAAEMVGPASPARPKMMDRIYASCVRNESIISS